ncbi:hypothetical protein ACFXCZ_16855 [Streptomyces sp. NPDC059396]|uniref:hypothetical protein n=1 Tax=Streptomyces sp. NPDC059396 TaxID=3346819 RepID=UPI00368E8E3F
MSAVSSPALPTNTGLTDLVSTGQSIAQGSDNAALVIGAAGTVAIPAPVTGALVTEVPTTGVPATGAPVAEVPVIATGLARMASGRADEPVAGPVLPALRALGRVPGGPAGPSAGLPAGLSSGRTDLAYEPLALGTADQLGDPDLLEFVLEHRVPPGAKVFLMS